MAENERFVIGKGICIDKYCRDYFRCDNCENNTGKTREEWEKIIGDEIYYAYVRGLANHIGVAKAVCDTLFGKSK